MSNAEDVDSSEHGPNRMLLVSTFEVLATSSQHDLFIPGKSSTDSLSDLSYLDTSVMMLFSSMAMHPPSPSLQQTFEVRAWKLRKYIGR